MDRSEVVELLDRIETGLLPVRELASKKTRAAVFLHGDLTDAKKAIVADFLDDAELKERFSSLTRQLLIEGFDMKEEDYPTKGKKHD